jgi:hypothetical protein
MPDPDAKDSHPLIFDQRGILWFTARDGDFVLANSLVNPSPWPKCRSESTSNLCQRDTSRILDMIDRAAYNENGSRRMRRSTFPHLPADFSA